MTCRESCGGVEEKAPADPANRPPLELPKYLELSTYVCLTSHTFGTLGLA